MSSVVGHNHKVIITPNQKALTYNDIIERANEATEVNDETLNDAVNTLISGYRKSFNHDELDHRDFPDQHPIASIEGLRDELDNIQEAISDIDDIREGAEAGATAYQKPEDGIPEDDLSQSVKDSLDMANSALQFESDPTVPAWAKQLSKPDYNASEIDYNGSTVADEITDINSKMSPLARSDNKLVSASEMGDAIASVEAKQLYATSSQGSFATKAALLSASTLYNANGTVATPTKNDVAYVLADESHNNKLSKYVIVSVVGTTITWGFVISLSDTTFTQAQMDAINSNITNAKRASYDAHVVNDNIHVTSQQKSSWNKKYTKPTDGIPVSDLNSGNIDTEVTEDSENLITSGAVYNAVADLQPKTITDTAGHFITDTVEGALAELGAAKLNPSVKTSEMTQEVGKDTDGTLWTTPGGGGGNIDMIELASETGLIDIPTDYDGYFFTDETDETIYVL